MEIYISQSEYDNLWQWTADDLEKHIENIDSDDADDIAKSTVDNILEALGINISY